MSFLPIPSFLIISLASVLSIYADDCIMKSSCVCVFPNGTGIDLTPAVPSTFYTAQAYDENLKTSPTSKYMELTTFYYFPCSDTTFNMTIPSDAKTTCNQALSVSLFIISF